MSTAEAQPERAAPHDRKRVPPPAGRVPGHLDLQDPLPRGPGPARAEAHAERGPALQRGRRRAARDDPAPAARRVPAAARDPPGARLAIGPGKEHRRRRAAGLADPDEALDLGELCERAAITPELARELEDFGLLQSRREGGDKLYPAGDVDVAVACAKLSRYGITARHLRTFRTAADRRPGCWSSSSRRRCARGRRAARGGVQELQTLAELAQELSQLLFRRDLRERRQP